MTSEKQTITGGVGVTGWEESERGVTNELKQRPCVYHVLLEVKGKCSVSPAGIQGLH